VSVIDRCWLLIVLLCGGIWLAPGLGLAGERFPNPLQMDEMVPGVDMELGGQEVFRVPVDMEVLRRMVKGELAEIQLGIDGKMAQFFLQNLRRHGDIATWIGSEADGKGHAVLTIGPDFLFGRVISQGRVFRYRPDPETGECVIEEVDPEAEAGMGDDMLEIPQASEELEQDSAGENTEPQAAAADTEEKNTIDVMVLYSAGLRERYGETSLVEGRIQHLVDLSNDSYDNSEIHTQLRLVYMKEVDYSDQTDNETALEDLTDNKGVFADVESLRDTYGADQVTLLRSYVGNHCGLAWIMTESSPDYAYAVVMDGTYGDKYCPDLAYTHELGHNFGCAHDRDNAGHDGIYDYSYGYQFKAGDNWYRTIMAYDCDQGCTEISHFSNPRVLYEGVPTGIAADQDNSADNALTIEQTRLIVAKYREEQDQDDGSESPELKLSATEHDFGQVSVNSQERFVLTVGNSGDATLEIGKLDPPAAPFAVTDDGCGETSLDPGEECGIEITYSPTEAGEHQSSLAIVSNDPDTARAEVKLSGTGVIAQPSLQVSPESVQFSSTWGNRTSSETVEIKNVGQDTLRIGQIGSSDPLAAPFSLDQDGCSNSTLEADETCTFVIGYTPDDDQDEVSDSVDIPSNDPEHPSVTLKVSVEKSFPWNMFIPIFSRFGDMHW